VFDWPYFLLLFAADLATYYGHKLHQIYRSGTEQIHLPPMAYEPSVPLSILHIVGLPISWSNVAVLIYGFFILPWYVVLICFAASLIAGAALHIALRSLLRGFFNPFIAVLVSWPILLVVVIWYFWSRFSKTN
jgi:hypothetical protein